MINIGYWLWNHQVTSLIVVRLVANSMSCHQIANAPERCRPDAALSAANRLPSRRGSLVRLQPVVFIMQKIYLDTYALKEERAGTFE